MVEVTRLQAKEDAALRSSKAGASLRADLLDPLDATQLDDHGAGGAGGAFEDLADGSGALADITS
eukprot:767175-Hanusia_phi.AAC.9